VDFFSLKNVKKGPGKFEKPPVILQSSSSKRFVFLISYLGDVNVKAKKISIMK
jgi:hypothetical protein